MAWEIEFTDEFGDWWAGLTEDAQDDVAFGVNLLREHGPALTRPYADTVRGSNFANMRELRVQHEGRPYRVLYAFNPRRTGILLIGGDKQATSVGMTNSCRGLIQSMRNICAKLERNRHGKEFQRIGSRYVA